jgi:hypothetical protein
VSEDKPLSPQDEAYGIARAKQLVAASRDPRSKELLARQIFDDAFTDEVPSVGAVKTRAGRPMKGHARRDTVPEMPPQPMQYEGNETATELAKSEYDIKVQERISVIANNERKLRALLWARNVFLDAGDPEDFGEALESAVREWFLCTVPELPRDTVGIEVCVKANARANWDTLKRIAQERMREAAE